MRSPVSSLILLLVLGLLLTGCGRREYPLTQMPEQLLLKSISGYAVTISTKVHNGQLSLIQHPQTSKPQELVFERQVLALHVMDDQLHVKFAGSESLKDGVLTWVYVVNDRGLLVKVDEVGVIDLLPRK